MASRASQLTTSAEKKLAALSFSRGASGRAPRVELHGQLRVGVVSARGLSAGETSVVGMLARVVTAANDTFCEVCAGPRSLLKTDICHGGGKDPVWDERGLIDVADSVSMLCVSVYAASGVNVGRITRPRTLGFCEVSVADIVKQRDVRREYELSHKHRKSNAGYITLEFEYTSVPEILRGPTGFYSVPNSYFPMRTGCMVSLFQDAHVPLGFPLPTPVDATNTPFVARSCWSEMYNAILGAQKVVYISGWSVITSLRLVREPRESLTLGELLKQKANEGVTVSVLIWDEVASVSLLGGRIQSRGIMATQDEETYAYFKNTRVHCEKVSRDDDGKNGVFGNLQTGGLWSHHIKNVVVDREFPPDGRRRRLVSYIGGLDLTFGRFDTPEHSLFRTLSTLHKDDFYQGCVLGSSSETGPREPWHDIHCCVEGHIAWDAARTFEDRWRRQAPATAGMAIRRMPAEEFASGEEERRILLAGREHWNAQFFRSMDERSVVYDALAGKEADFSLGSKKGRAVEAGIVRAYIHYIRIAERFVYIENQYFCGGSHQWDKASNVSDNLIPCEIVRKICTKIERREPFCVYVVVPLQPEGAQVTPVEEVLRWQSRTVESMYKQIAETIRRCGLSGSVLPTDYLSIFCLGKRESNQGGQETAEPLPNSTAYLGFEARRNMIYVHSKLLVVDDTVALVGSANVNTRSMSGTRDTEIAVGIHQPAHTLQSAALANFSVPRGQVHCFRLSLWGEHLRFLDNRFLEPSSMNCMRLVREHSFRNWLAYVAPPSARTNVEMRGHLMLYPYEVDLDGSLSARVETIPDLPSVSVIGKNSLLLPDIGTG